MLLAATVCLSMAGTALAAMPQLADPLDLPSQAIVVTSDRCIQLEQQFDAVSGEHAANPNISLAQSYRDKGSYLCNNDVEDIGEEQLEKALQLLGVEPDPVP
jgi:hypothetical protein